MNKNEQALPNLIPAAGEVNGDYLCTWRNQGVTVRELGVTGIAGSDVRDVLDQERLFGSRTYYHTVGKEQRSNLIFLLDDGWDLPYGIPNDAPHKALFGLVEPDPEKFSTFGNTPLERLCGISAKVKEKGYAGLGLWISPQQAGETSYDPESARLYWEERARMCHEAGVLYWKVDWGFHDGDLEYRRMMSEAVRKYAPGLWVEHAVVQQPLTKIRKEGHPDSDMRREMVKDLMEYCDAYRIYDLCAPFRKVCTLQRASEALTVQVNQELDGRGCVNAESEPDIGAALGLTVGIMEFDKNMQACLNWHRIAPPFGIHGNNCICSEERLEDYQFCENDLASWHQEAGEVVRESAPAIIARNCPLPIVKKRGEHAPYVLASKNPITSAYSVATIRRTIDPNPMQFFLADVTVQDVDPEAPIGVFGVFGSLTIQFSAPIPENCKVLVQDLIADTSIDVTDHVKMDDQSIVLDGMDLRFWGKTSRGICDDSDPSLMIKLIR